MRTISGHRESVLIVATRNRLPELRTLLESVRDCAVRPDTILISDASDDVHRVELRDVCREFGVILMESPIPNASAQRNLALDHVEQISCSFVHFLDDDCVVEPGYFGALHNTFRELRVCGAGGLVIGTTSPFAVLSHAPKLAARFQGRLLPTAHNIGVWAPIGHMVVDWLPGCSMSFRAELIRGFRFDELRGDYSLGEDVDFSARVSQSRGRLVVNPKAKVNHLRAGYGRPDPVEFAVRDVRSRLSLARSGIGNARRFPTIVSIAFVGVSKVLHGRVTKQQASVDCGKGMLKALREQSVPSSTT